MDHPIPLGSPDHNSRVWMLPVSQGDFQTVLVSVIGIGRVSGLIRCGSELPRAVMVFDHLGSKSILRALVARDL